uniref:YqaJ viral recombinase domain-containing protein n=1 Tax=Stegastes partitus TaxID=144197 RepID=A0A3B5A834_9TELE
IMRRHKTTRKQNKASQNEQINTKRNKMTTKRQKTTKKTQIETKQMRVVEQVEVLTRGQRINPDWFAWRKYRITASVAHRIAHCRFVNGGSKTPPPSYLAAITGEGPRVQTRAMCWGVDNEAEAVRRYQKLKSAALGRPVSVQDCGLFIDAQRPWLAGSPDGIVTDSQTGQWLLCLEVKCPFKHRQRRVEEACREDPAFCLEIQDEEGQYHLKTSHCYFTQIQCQLAVTGLQRAELVVFTLKETAVVPVDFQPEFWDETLSRLEVFYRDAVQPHVRQKMQQQDAAAWTPEL